MACGERSLPLLELVEVLHAVQDCLLGRLLHLARQEELVKDHVHLQRGRGGPGAVSVLASVLARATGGSDGFVRCCG
eukprot:scaffold10239_cov122-Isochrysis_galbana.AAC.8